MKYIFYLTLPLYLLDQISKALINHHIQRPTEFQVGEVVEVTPFFNLTHIRNEGVAFGMANGTQWANIVFGIVLPDRANRDRHLVEALVPFLGKLTKIAAAPLGFRNPRQSDRPHRTRLGG